MRLLFGALLLIPSVAHAEVTFRVRPELGVQTGYETFGLALAIPQASATSANEVSSLLTYPQHGFIGGGEVTVDAGSVGWIGSIHTNLHNPWGKMVDQDFISLRDGSSVRSVEFSHTESETRLRSVMADLAFALRVAEPSDKGRILALIGFRYESHTYEIIGAEGWQLDAQSRQVAVALPPGTRALDYRTQYRLPFLGMRFDGNVTSRFSLVTEARVLPSFSIHEDDHVLRNKRATAKPFGLGFALSAAPMVRVAGNVFLGAKLQLQYLTAVSGALKQKYYADDPFIDGDQTQSTIPDSNFSFTYVRAGALAFAEARF